METGRGWRAGHRLSGCQPRDLEAVVPVRWAGPCPALLGWLAVPAGVVLGDGEAEGFEFGDELAEPFVVVEPGA